MHPARAALPVAASRTEGRGPTSGHRRLPALHGRDAGLAAALPMAPRNLHGNFRVVELLPRQHRLSRISAGLGALVSGTGHVAAIAWVMIVGVFVVPGDGPAHAVSEVSLVSPAALDAMTAPAPAMPRSDAPTRENPVPEATSVNPLSPEVPPAPVEQAARMMAPATPDPVANVPAPLPPPPVPGESTEIRQIAPPQRDDAPQFAQPAEPAASPRSYGDLWQPPAPEVAPTADRTPPPPLPDATAEPAAVPKPAKELAAAPTPKPVQSSPDKQETQQAPQPGTKSGSAPSAGAKGTGSAAAASGKGAADLRAGWMASIRAKIERRKAYPKAAGGSEGRVKLQVTVGRDGRLAAVGIVQSSGNAALDAAAVRAVKTAGRFSKAPKGLDDASVTFVLPLRFSQGF